MKKQTLLIAIICLFGLTQVKAIRYYNDGDTLFVWAQSGLILRDAPDLKSKKIAALPFGTIVVPKIYKQTDGVEMSIEVISSCIYEGQNYYGYKIPGNWVQVSANGKTGYVFDGFLSKYPPPNNQEQFEWKIDSYLTRFFGLASHVEDKGKSQHAAKLDCNFYKNGAFRQSRGIGNGLSQTTYVLPELSLEEGYLITNYFCKLEKSTNKTPLDPEESSFFLKTSTPYLLDFSADKPSMSAYVSVGCVNGVVVITTLYSC